MPKFNSLEGDWALGSVFNQIRNFSDISWYFKILSLKLFCNSRGNLYWKFLTLDRYQFSLCYRQIGSVLDHCKVPKCYDDNCRFKNFLSDYCYLGRNIKARKSLFMLDVFKVASIFYGIVILWNVICLNLRKTRFPQNLL